MNYKRTIIAVRGDTQGGHAGGLLNPETQIPEVEITEEGETRVCWRTPELRPVQKRLWQWHTQDLEAIRALAGDSPVVWLEMGDLTQGNVFKDDLAETNLSAQYFISRWNTVPLLGVPNVRAVYFVKGTGVHVWGEGATETMLTYQLKAMYPEIKITIADHWLLGVDGFLLDVAHHGPGAGIRNWTRGNVVRLYTESIMRDCIDLGRAVPDVVLRAHYHEPIYTRAVHQTGGRVWKTDSFITPPYCFIGSHAQKVIRSPGQMSVGMLALEIVNGKLLNWHSLLHTVDLRSREVV